MQKTWWILAGFVVAALLAVLVLGIERGDAPAFVLFVGRFHPTVVHFPIALLLLAIVIEVLAARSSYVAQVRPAVPFVLLLGALSALASVVLGYLLSLGGGYDDALLSLHLRLGLAVMVLAFILALVSLRMPSPGRVFRGSMVALGMLVIVAGHLGGSLARGSGYLTYYLPAPVKQWVGLETGPGANLIANVDSALVYADLVQPILDRRCVKCHGPGKTKGNLRLDAPAGIEAGGRDGVVVVAGHPSQSELLRRITLPPYDEDAMPPDGEPPLDVGETEVIRWWIENGASFEARVGHIEGLPSAVATYLNRVAAPRAPMRSGIYALDVPPADTTALAALRSTGLVIAQIAPDAPFLHVSASGLRDEFTNAAMEKLRRIAPQIAELDLGHTAVTAAGAAVLQAMPHLTHLHLEHTAVGDDALRYLAELQYLEYLNLYGTDITDRGLPHLYDLPALRSIYLWQTQVTDDGAASLRAFLPGLDVNLGTSLADAAPDTISAPRP